MTHGTVGPYDSAEEEWETYVERVEIYLDANKITDAGQKRDVLLSVCGAKTHHILRDLLAPEKPKSCSYVDIVKRLADHFNPKQGVAVKRYQFNSRSRQPGESISKYVAELRHLAIGCEFGDSLSEMLRDRLVCGINDPRMQRRLLSESDLHFDKALKTALAMEMADRDAEQLRDGATAITSRAEVPVNKAGLGNHKRSGKNNGCYRCGGKHLASSCRHKNTVCYQCNKKGHLSRVCRSKQTQPASHTSTPNTNSLEEGQEQVGDELHTMFPVRSMKHPPIYATVRLNQVPVVMEVDTGATLSVISEKMYHQLWKSNAPQIVQSKVKLRTYTGDEIPVIGALNVQVSHAGQQKQLQLVVTEGNGPALLGRNWLEVLQINWKGVYQVRDTAELEAVLAAHDSVFKSELGTITCTKAQLHMDPNVPPSFHRPRPIPYAVKDKVEAELERLEREGILKPRQFSQWASPIVAVTKKDGSVRICGDYKVSVNKAMACDVHPIPRSEDIFAAMAGGVTFSKLDLSHAYLQLQLEESAKDYVVINTHKGLFEYTRMPFGITAAPAIFQRTMDNILQGLKHVCVYIDDILITGESEEEHLRTLKEVLNRLEKAGVRLKKEKCVFMAPTVVYLGHQISREGLQPTMEKVRAITLAQRPANINQLRAFLGLVNFYGKFMKNLSTLLAPLYKLLRKGVD